MGDSKQKVLVLARTLGLLIAGIVCTVLSAVGLATWEGSEYYQRGPIDKKVWFGYDPVTLTGMIVFCTCAIPAPVFLYTASMTFLRYATHDSSSSRKSTMANSHAGFIAKVAIAVHALLGAIFFLVGVVAVSTWGADPMKCGVIFCIGIERYKEDPSVPADRTRNIAGASLNALIALMAFVLLCPWAMVMWWRALRLRRQLHREQTWRAAVADRLDVIGRTGRNSWRSDAEENSNGRSAAEETYVARGSMACAVMRPYLQRHWKSQLPAVLCVVLVFTFLTAVGLYLPNDVRRFVASYIAQLALTQPTLKQQKAPYYTAPELPGAWFRTRGLRVTANLHIKLFPGNVFFYAFILSVFLTAWIFRQSRRGRRWVQSRFTWCPSVTVGELAVSASTLLLVMLFTMYWAHDHNYKKLWSEGKAMEDGMPKLEVFARAVGQVATLLLSLLFFPISRHSVIHRLMGVSAESVVWMHRLLGYGMLLATFIHMVAFLFVYRKHGLLWSNLTTLPTVCCHKKVRNNFTIIVITWAMTLVFVFMGLFGLWRIRRRCFELFYYSHLIGTFVLLPVTLWHVASGWQYILPGLLLWMVDRFIRLFRSSALVTVTYARLVGPDVAQIGFRMNRSDMAVAHPGQYVFINIPEISVLQWHPFTLSSPATNTGAGLQLEETWVTSTYAVAPAPSATCADIAAFNAFNARRNVKMPGVLELTIQSMGPKTWTGQLCAHIAAGRDFAMGVDGPCGDPVDFSQYEEVFLVCGGIGVTPCASVYGSLLRQKEASLHRAIASANATSTDSANASGTHNKVPARVKFIWCVRSPALVETMASTLRLPRLSWQKKEEKRDEVTGYPKRDRDEFQPQQQQQQAEGFAEDDALSLPTSTQNGFECCLFYTGCPANCTVISANDSNNDDNNGTPADESISSARPAPREGEESPTQPALSFSASAKASSTFSAITAPDPNAAAEMGNGNTQAASRGRAMLSPFAFACGRPDFQREIDPQCTNLANVLVLTCGPTLMTDEVVRVCAKLGVVVRQEEFLL